MKLKEYYKDTEGLIYLVMSERDNTTIYVVAVDKDDGWYCTCEDYKFRKHKCKHIRAVIQYLQKNYQSDYEKYKQCKTFVE